MDDSSTNEESSFNIYEESSETSLSKSESENTTISYEKYLFTIIL